LRGLIFSFTRQVPHRFDWGLGAGLSRDDRISDRNPITVDLPLADPSKTRLGSAHTPANRPVALFHSRLGERLPVVAM
jgi:hypothetical protein